MSALQARYFDGRTSRRHDVSLLLTGSRLKIVSARVDLDYELARVRLSTRMANTPRWVYLPGGGACVTEDNDALDRHVVDSRLERVAHKWETRPALAALAVLLVVACAWFLIDWGVPLLADAVAQRIPAAAEEALGTRSLAEIDRFMAKPSTLSPGTQAELRDGFDRVRRAGGDKGSPVRLEFRSSPLIGPNAFALPSGIIVITDQLTTLAGNNDEIYAVLSHELGHVRHRHVMRGLLQTSMAGLVIAGLTGDIASGTALAATAPTVLLQTKFSRDMEREADRFGFELMGRAGISPLNFAAILERMQNQAAAKHAGVMPAFLSNHPSTPEREQAAREFARQAGQPSGT